MSAMEWLALCAAAGLFGFTMYAISRGARVVKRPQLPLTEPSAHPQFPENCNCPECR